MTMFSPRYQELVRTPHRRETKERVQWTWKLLAILSSNILLVGYLIFPVAFDRSGDNVGVNQPASIIIASVFVGMGYALSVILLFCQSRNPDFLLHSVFLPYLASSLLSLFNVIVNILCRDLLPLSHLELLIVVLLGAFALFYALAASWIYFRGSFIKRSPPRDTDVTPALLTEEEMQRQQLLKLLQTKNSPAPSPDIIQNTFRIDLPDRPERGRGYDRYMPPPADSAWT